MKFSLTTGQACSTLVLVTYALSLSAAPSFAETAKSEQTEDEGQLDPIVVTGTLDNKDTIAQSEVSSDLIDRTQSATVPGLLSNLPSIEMIGNSRVDGQSINILGFSDSEDIEITIDGAQKNFEKYRQGSVFVEPELLKIIEVSKGTFAAEKYGAFGGTVEMTTKSASDMLQPGKPYGAFGKIGFATNGSDFVKSSAAYARNEELGFEALISATHRNNTDYQVGGNNHSLALSAGEMFSSHFKTSLERDDHFFELSGMIGYSDNYKAASAERGIIDPKDSKIINLIKRFGSFEEALKTLAVDREILDTSLSGKYEYSPSNDLIDFALELSYSSTAQHDRRRIPTAEPNYSSALSSGGDDHQLDYSVYKIDMRNTSEFDLLGLSSSLKYGIQARHLTRDSMSYVKSYLNFADYNYGHLQPFNIPGGSQSIYSAWSELTLEGEKIEFTPGVRYDFISSEGDPNLAPKYNRSFHDYGRVLHSGFSPSVSAIYTISPNIKLFTDVAYKFRAPLIDEIYDVGTRTATSQQLTTERVFAKRIGLASRFDDVLTDEDSLSARLSVYHNSVYDNIHRLRGNNSRRYTEVNKPNYINLKGYHTQGIEAEAYYDSKQLFASAAFSFMEGEHNGSVLDMYASRDMYVGDIAPTKLVLSLGYKIPEYDLLFGWKGQFVDAQDRLAPKTINGKFNSEFYFNLYKASKGYSVHDVFMSWTPKEGRFAGIEARASIENIFNKNYRPFFSEADAPEKGINFKSSVSYKF